VLRHRIVTNFNAEAEAITTDDIVRRLIENISVYGASGTGRGRLPQVFRSAGPR
jgi:MoxR-like ATPase